MKQKKFMPRLLIALMSVSLLGGCNPSSNPSDQPGEPDVPSEPSDPTGPSEDETIQFDIKFVNYDGTTLQSGKVDKDVVPSYDGTTPTKPDSETETFTFSGWDKEIVAATENATYTAQFTATPKVVASAPVITISGNTEFTVNAGESLTLPTVTAKNYLEEDLTEDIEIEDSMGESSVHRGVFSSLIAGVHEIEFYVEDENGDDSETITVTVTPATPESTIGEGHSKDYHTLANYGIYEENFEDGVKSSAMSTLVDSKKAGFITSTEEAIQGNSFVFNTKAIYGGAQYALFFQTIPNELKGVQVNYNISFDYKKVYRLEEGQTKEQLDAAFNGLYFSPSYDAVTSIGKDTKLPFTNPDANGVYHFEESYDHFNFDTEGNAYLRFFNHFGNAQDPGLAFNNTYLAIDNIVVEAIQVPQIAYSVPTAEQLMEEEGFVWDFSTNGANFSNSTYLSKDNISNETVKTAIGNDTTNFPGDVIHITGANTHGFTGLTSTNVITGKIIDVTMYYYAVNESFVVLLMNGNGSGNPEAGKPANAEVINGSVKKLHFTYQLQGKADGLVNVYGLNSSLDIYVGKVEVKMYDYVAPQEELTKPTGVVPTLAQLQEGYTWDQSAENMMDGDNTTYISNANIENETVKNAIAADTTGFGENSIRFKGGKLYGITAENVESGKNLVVEFDYYTLGNPQCLILMGVDDANNETQSNAVMQSTVVEGDLKHMVITVSISDNVLANGRANKAVLNFYSGSTDWYIGKITAKLETPVHQEEQITPTGSAPSLQTVMAAGESGYVFDLHSNGEKFATKTATPVTGVLDETVKTALTGSQYVADGYVIHFSALDGENVQFNGINATNAPSGKDVKIEMVYYCVTDSTHKLVGGSGAGTVTDLGNGFKKWSYSVSNNPKAVEYISFYQGNFEVYVCSVTLAVTDYVEPVTFTVPTTDELKAGVTFDGTNKHTEFTNSTYLKVSEIADADVKAALQGDSNFGDYVSHVSGSGSHQLKAVVAANEVVGLTLEVTFSYYVVGENFYALMMSQGGTNPELKTCTGSLKGTVKTVTVSYTISDTVDNVFNLYGASEGNDIYVGNISVKLYKTLTASDFLNAGEQGFVFNMHSNNEKFEGASAIKVSDMEDSEIKTALAESQYLVDGYVIHVKQDTNNNWKFNGLNATNLPAGNDVKIEMVYYAVKDSTHKLVSGSGKGSVEGLEGNFKKWTFEEQNLAKAIDYISFYDGNFDVYVCSIKVIMTGPKTTAKGYKVHDVITLCESGAGYWTNKNGYVTSDFDSGIEIDAQTMPGLGTAPKKVTFDGGNIVNYTEICQVNNIEAGVKYRFKLALYNVTGYDGNLYLYDNSGNGTFLQLPTASFSSVGYHEVTVDYQFASAPGWMLFYTNSTDKSGTIYVGALTAEVLEINQ